MRRHPRSTQLVVLFLALLFPTVVSARAIVSPSLRNVENGEPPLKTTVTTEIPGKGTCLDLFLEGSVDEAALTALGVMINSRLANGVLTAEVPLASFQQVAGLPGMRRISAAYRAKHCINVSVPGTQATPNYWTSSPPNFTGQAGAGVIVGDVDSGIDYSQDDFKKPDGSTRLLNIWDQTVVGTPPAGYAYGTEWSQANINAGLPAKDTDGHGTHVMGIAAGDGSATGNGQPANRFVGMAPNADIIMVRTDFSTTHIVDGVNYIFQRAAALGKNAVVNLSLGSAFGAHDGTETFDTSIDGLTGAGRIVVASAGNEGGQSLHALQVVPAGGGNQTVTFSIPTYTTNGGAGNDFVEIDAYYPGAADMSVSVTSPRGTSNLGPITKGNWNQKTGTTATDGAIYIENGYTASPSGDANIYIQIWDSAAARYPRVGTWTITLTPVSGTNPQLDLWLAGYQLGSAYVQPLFTSDVDEHDTVGSPGSASQVITVGAYTSKTKWPSINGSTYSYTDSTAVGTLTQWTSVGPLRNGAQKPDIAAPGEAIVSSLSSVTSPAPNQALVNPDGVHWTMAGTSMSAPHVTGGAALILADTPNLTPAQVKAKLFADARVDANTGSVPNYQWGYGKLRMLRNDSQAPSVTVNAPNGGETWGIGTAHDITWTATDNVGVTSITIQYSADNGGSWNPVASGEANDGVYSWTVPNAPTALALVKVTAYDAASNSGSDASNAVFTIADQTAPSVTVNAPNGGETWAIGSAHDITWTATDNVGVTSIDIQYSTDNGGSWNPVASGEANDGVYAWTVPNAPTVLALVKVTAHDAASNSGSDASNAVFTIADQTAPSVAVNSPNGGESWAAGSAHDITWTATDNVGVTSIDIQYSTDNGGSWNPVASGEANDGVYAWTVPNTATALALVKVTAHDAASNSGSDASDAVFAIVDQSAPSVTVTAPNGGETWAIGAVHDITWTATDDVGVTSIDIEYSTNDGATWNPVTAGEVNDGVYAWTVPNAPTVLALVKVTAHDAASNSGSDLSNAVFTIADQTAPSVAVTAPNGGESWGIGTVHDITWTATDNVGVASIDIEYSTNNGATWIPLAAGEANDGAYAWTVPNAPTALALVKVTAHDAASNSSSDLSNAVFTIADQTAPSVAVTAPNGGEAWAIGTTENITWTATDNVGVTSIDIEYSIDDGASWLPVAAGEANDGTYAWSIPNTPSIQARVRVVAHDAATNTGADQSDLVFSIQTVSGIADLLAGLTRPTVLQNRPNPFNPSTIIGFALPEATRVRIEIFAANGALVRRLVDAGYGRGYNQVIWDGRSDTGRSVSSGVFFYRFRAGGVTETKRLVVGK